MFFLFGYVSSLWDGGKRAELQNSENILRTNYPIDLESIKGLEPYIEHPDREPPQRVVDDFIR